MSQNFVQPGDHLTVVAPGDVLSGGGVNIGKIFGIASGNALEGEEVVIAVTGVFELTKPVEDVIGTGDDLYWIDAVQAATGTSGTIRIGVAIEDAGAGSATVKCRLVPV